MFFTTPVLLYKCATKRLLAITFSLRCIMVQGTVRLHARYGVCARWLPWLLNLLNHGCRCLVRNFNSYVRVVSEDNWGSCWELSIRGNAINIRHQYVYMSCTAAVELINQHYCTLSMKWVSWAYYMHQTLLCNCPCRHACMIEITMPYCSSRGVS